MTSRPRPDTAPLVNPYRTVPDGPQVRGATVGRLGLAVGVIAVAAAPGGWGEGPVPGDTQVWFGTALAVAQEMTQSDTSSGYLWPAPAVAGPPASPAFDT